VATQLAVAATTAIGQRPLAANGAATALNYPVNTIQTPWAL